MNENIVLQVTDVLNKYDKCYTRNGILKNLNQWNQNKGALIDILRRHSNWNEAELAVVFEVTESREIDRYTVSAHSNGLLQLIADLEIFYDDAGRLRNALYAATGTCAKLLPNEQTVSSIKENSGVSCTVGQKASRVIHKICQKYGLDKHPEYNARFAKLADSLNPMQVKRTALLSVHPCDYLEMSNEDNSWSSCHCIRDGEYHAGTLSYMNDGASIVFYTVDEEVIGDYHKSPKRTRQVFCYSDGLLLQSRLYPQTDDEESRNIYRDIVQRTISQCLDLPNLWKLHRSMESVNQYCSTHRNALHYADYIYKCYSPNVSILKEARKEDESRIIIGKTPFCLDCGCNIRDSDSLYCESCGYGTDYIACEDCGERIERDSDDDYYVGGCHYCRDCVSWCEHCEEYSREEMTCVTDCNGYQIRVCEYCLEQHYFCCDDCGEYFPKDTGSVFDDGFHCNDCLESRYFPCNSCGRYVQCEYTVEIDHKPHCTGCGKNPVDQEAVNSMCFITV